MSFREKSAWVMLIALLVTGGLYLNAVWSGPTGPGLLAEPSVGMLAAFTVVLVLISIIGHVALAVLAPRDAAAGMDERDRLVTARASHSAYTGLTAGAILSLGAHLVTGSPTVLFHGVFISVLFGHITEYGTQALLYRRAV